MSQKVRSIVKKPASAALLYSFDWTDWLSTLTISTSTWTIEPAAVGGFDGDTTCTSSSASILTGSQKTQALISGGVPGRRYKVINTITTSGTPSQTGVEHFYLEVEP